MRCSPFFLTLFFIPFFSYSQNTHFVSIGPDLSIPSTNLGSANVSLGGSFQYQLKFNAPVAAQLHVGYAHFEDQFGGKVSFLPVRAGLAGFLYQDLLFVSADAGFSKYHSPTTGTKQTGFSFGTGAGYRLPLSNKQFLQFSAYYNLHNFKNDLFGQNYNYNWFNIRAAFGLAFGKGKATKEE
jgi:hypothetical protein